MSKEIYFMILTDSHVQPLCREQQMSQASKSNERWLRDEFFSRNCRQAFAAERNKTHLSMPNHGTHGLRAGSRLAGGDLGLSLSFERLGDCVHRVCFVLERKVSAA
jgi:hypothetical protein